MMSRGAYKMRTGSRVAIIGGGPSGCFFAAYLLKYAHEYGIKPEITIYEPRDFSETGPKACKGCAGILSVPLLKNLVEIGLSIPEEIIQKRIERYTVRSPHTSITISNPEADAKIVSVYRGGGPRMTRFQGLIGFDLWLLDEIQKRGVRIERNAVSGICASRPLEINVAGEKREYDLIVLAAGINSRPVPIEGLRYIPPQTQTMAQDELEVENAEVNSCPSDVVQAFLIPNSGLVFGSLVPKGPLINVSVLSKNEPPMSVGDFLQHKNVRGMLPYRCMRVCGCSPKIAVGSARNYYGDGFVAVGDAVVSRLYKDGIGSSLLTAREAALTAIRHGFSRRDFKRHYRPLCQKIDRDNRWGRWLFWINDKVKDSPIFLWAQHRLIGDEQINVRGPQFFTRAVWGMFTGSYSYRSIARMTLNPISLWRLLAALLRETARSIFHKNASPRSLHIGARKVLILGSGFVGTYVLRSLVPALNKNENVNITMISNENFFLFSPLLHEVAMGRIETRHIAYPVRRLHWRDRFNFLHACVQKIDLRERKVIIATGELDFDYLVLALGSIADKSELNSHDAAKVFTLKSLHDSILIRNHIIGLFELASMEKDLDKQRELLSFVVSGGGYKGIQLVAELRDFIHSTLLKLYRSVKPECVRLVLVEAECKIVPELHARLGAYILKHLKSVGIEVREGSQITGVWKDRIEINGGESVPTHTLLWVAGVVANPRIAELDATKDSIGRILVNEHLNVPGFPGVYAAGDCAHFEDQSGQPIPARAHTAVRQAKIVAHNILGEIRGRDKKPYNYKRAPEMVSLGGSHAICRVRNLWLHGFSARLAWLVGYSLLIAGTYNRIRILIDWLISAIFGRDTTFLRLNE
jgi:NADH:ubiquinone reductase (H+-translocating)